MLLRVQADCTPIIIPLPDEAGNRFVKVIALGHHLLEELPEALHLCLLSLFLREQYLDVALHLLQRLLHFPELVGCHQYG